MGLKFDATKLIPNVEMVDEKAEKAIKMLLYTDAQLLSDYAKTHRRWTDRTGMARRSLTAIPGKTVRGYRIKLAHGVDYGVNLELGNNRKYAIINESINAVAPQILKDFEGLLNKIK